LALLLLLLLLLLLDISFPLCCTRNGSSDDGWTVANVAGKRLAVLGTRDTRRAAKLLVELVIVVLVMIVVVLLQYCVQEKSALGTS
jgi:hypothetical protein